MSADVALAAVALVAGLAVRLARRRWVVVTVTGSSMAPTLRDGQRLLARRVRDPLVARGAVVVFRLPPHLVPSDDPDRLTLRIKRAAAVADDPLPPAYRAEPWAAGATHVPRGKLVVAGDNPHSQGSRELGFVDEADVVAVLAIPASTRARTVAWIRRMTNRCDVPPWDRPTSSVRFRRAPAREAGHESCTGRIRSGRTGAPQSGATNHESPQVDERQDPLLLHQRRRRGRV
jgi:signal peptidase I